MSTGGAPRAPGHSLTAQAVEWLSKQFRVQFKKKMKEGRKKRERKRQRREQKERRRGQRERKEEGRQASEKDGHHLGF